MWWRNLQTFEEILSRRHTDSDETPGKEGEEVLLEERWTQSLESIRISAEKKEAAATKRLKMLNVLLRKILLTLFSGQKSVEVVCLKRRFALKKASSG